MDSIDNFSWRRVAMVSRLYASPIRIQLLIYIGIVTLIYFGSILSNTYLGTLGPLFLLGGTAINWMMYLAPLAFSRNDDMVLLTELPAQPREKALMFIGYAYVVVPAVIALTWLVCYVIGFAFPVENITFFSLFRGTSSEVLEVMGLDRWVLNLSTVLGWYFTLSFTLYVVMASRSNRAVRCVLTVVGIGVALFIVILVAFLIIFIPIISDAAESGAEIGEDHLTDLISAYVDIIPYITAVTAMIIAGMTWLTWRKICNRQI